MVRRLLDAVDVVLEGGVTPGVVLLLLRLNPPPRAQKLHERLQQEGSKQERTNRSRGSAKVDRTEQRNDAFGGWGSIAVAPAGNTRIMGRWSVVLERGCRTDGQQPPDCARI